jgi:hypothetical protein
MLPAQSAADEGKYWLASTRDVHLPTASLFGLILTPGPHDRRSALLVGSGVAGNRVVGKTDDALVAESIDFRTGLPSSSGSRLGCENLGTAILSLGGLDPAEHLPGIEVLEAVIG